MTPEQVHEKTKIINGEKIFADSLYLTFKKLTSLEPYNLSNVIINGNFCCDANYLISLKGAPKQVNGGFWCNDNHLTSLKGAPKQVNFDFSCSSNKLTSLKGAPKQVGGDFWCYGNPLTSLEGLPETIGGLIFIEKEVLQRLYFTNDLIAIYDLHDKFIFI